MARGVGPWKWSRRIVRVVCVSPRVACGRPHQVSLTVTPNGELPAMKVLVSATSPGGRGVPPILPRAISGAPRRAAVSVRLRRLRDRGSRTPCATPFAVVPPPTGCSRVSWKRRSDRRTAQRLQGRGRPTRRRFVTTERRPVCVLISDGSRPAASAALRTALSTCWRSIGRP